MLARLRPLLLSSASGGGSGGRLLLLSTARGLASSAAEAEETLYEQGEAQHVGSIVAAQLEHKGRGLIGRHSVAVGELLMAVPPAVIIHGDQDEQPEADQLVPALLEAGQRTGLAAALGALFNGTGAPQHDSRDVCGLHLLLRAGLPMCQRRAALLLLLPPVPAACLHAPRIVQAAAARPAANDAGKQ